MGWTSIVLLIWLTASLSTLGFGIWLEMRLARLEQRPPLLRGFLYPRTLTVLLMWPLYLMHYGSSMYLLRKYLFGKPPSIHNVLLTGRPGCGKTTVIRRLAQGMGDLRLAGFYTEEIREQGHRVGFEAISFSGRRALLAHVQSPSPHRVGPYGVEPEQLEPLVQEELVTTGEADVCLIDEAGKMEVLCPAFIEVVPRLLSGKVPVIMTVAQRGRGLIAQVKYRADVRLVTVTKENRDTLPEELERWVRERLSSR